MRSEYRKNLLDKPSVTKAPYCAICGRPASNLHHVIPKGMGGVSREMESRIPKIRLCGNGNVDGCHGLVHQGFLHINWEDGMGGWVFRRSSEPMGDEESWRQFWSDYLPIPGWDEQKHPTIVFGRKS